MKINTAKLKRALDELKLIASRKAGLEILYCVHLKAENGYLEITASNLDEYQLEWVECVGELTACCVGRERLGWAIGGEETIIELVDENLTVSFGRNEVVLKTLEADQFPAWPAGDMEAIGVSCPDMARGIESVAFAACTNGSREELATIHIVGKPKSIACEACNSHELAIWKADLISAMFDVVIPSSIVPNFCSALTKDGSTFSISENLVQVAHDFGKYAAKQLSTRYPNTEALINSITDQIEFGTLKISELADVVDRCAFYGDPQKSMAVDVHFSKDGAEFKCVGNNSDMVFYIDGKFPDWETRYNADSLKMCLRAVKSDTATLAGSNITTIIKYGDVSIYTNGLRKEKKETKKAAK